MGGRSAEYVRTVDRFEAGTLGGACATNPGGLADEVMCG